ncbi:MAG: gliding motility-associated C-terminal domain-containing protein [Nonlabens sp.]
MNRYFCLSFICVLAFAKAQQESAFWFFGINAGIDFNTGAAISIDNGNLVTREGCATISDRNGNLLFYTDGTVVYNRNHQLMPNGSDLKGDSSSTSSAIVVPKPGNSRIYYVFTVDTDDNLYRDTEGMFYSVIDMSLDNGNGDVDIFEKNINILPVTSEKLTAVSNSTDDGYWIVTHFENQFYAYELTSSGFDPSPVISTVDPFIELIDVPYTNVDVSAMRGYIKINPTGNKLAAAHFSNNTSAEFVPISNLSVARSTGYANGGELYVYDFDNATGVVSNPIPLATRADGGSFYGVEFSSDGRYLYTEADYMTPSPIQFIELDRSEVLQYDLNATDIRASKNILFTSTIELLRGALQLGLDGKIYHSFPGNINSIPRQNLSTITQANSIGAVYNLDSFALTSGTSAVYGLPIFLQNFIATAQIEGDNHCFETEQEFFATSSDPIDSVEWNFGDPSSGAQNTATGQNTTHVFSAPGTFTVTAEVETPFGVTVESIDIEVFEQVSLGDFTNKFTVCNEGFGIGAFNLSPSIDDLQSFADNQLANLYRSRDQAQNLIDPIINLTSFSNISNPQELFARVSNENCFQIVPIFLNVENCDVEIFNIITPNEDGKNDTFTITGLRNIYLDHKLSIFNRYGQQVWEGGNEDAPWGGRANLGLLSGDDILPTGTYFYVLEFNEDDLEPRSGYVYLN